MILVVFDMDGTLIDSGAAITSRVRSAFATLDLEPPSTEVIRGHVGLSLPIYMAALAGSDDPELIDRLITAYRAIGAAAPAGQMLLFEGARAVLERLHQRPDTLLAVATGKGQLGLERALMQNDIADYFVSLQSADNNPSKPHPSMLHSAMADAGVGPESTVMIGDAAFDIEMAGAAGVRSIAVAWGLQPVAALRAAGATAVAENFDDLYDAIERVLE